MLFDSTATQLLIMSGPDSLDMEFSCNVKCLVTDSEFVSRGFVYFVACDLMKRQ